MAHIDTLWIKGPSSRICFRVDIESDPYTTPDTYAKREDSPELFAAYEAGTVRYVGVIVTPVVNGARLGEFAANMRGIAYGSCKEWAYDVGAAHLRDVYPVPLLLAEVRAHLDDLYATLTRWYGQS